MINNNTIKYWARNKLFGAGFSQSEFAWPNRNFDSSDLDIFYKERYIVTDEGINGCESNVKSGMIFYDVVGNRGSGDDILDNSCAAIAALFEPADNKEVAIESGLKIDIDEATTGAASPYGESRHMMPVRIAFRAYETST